MTAFFQLIRATLIGALAVTACATGVSAQQSFASWFKVHPHVLKDWDIAAEPGGSSVLTIRPRDHKKASEKKVLVLYPRPSSAYDIAISKVLEVFDAKELNVTFTVVNFELKDGLGRNALRMAEANKFDLIFGMGSESTAWLYDNYKGNRIPVVSICSKDPVQLGQMRDYESGSGNNFAFTSLNMPVDVFMAYLLDLSPELRNLAILVDSKNVSAVQTQAEPIAELAVARGMQVIMGSVDNPAKAAEELATIVPNAVRRMRESDPDLTKSAFLITGSTSVFKEIKAINEKSEQVPVVSMIPEIVTTGRDSAALAMGISFESNAHLAAIYGADILNGRARAGDLKVGIVSPPDIAISFLKAREIGMRVPFSFFETASFIYDYDGKPVRAIGVRAN
jgi:putative tryptophan/tyrosine transport system substrate-binding protein